MAGALDAEEMRLDKQEAAVLGEATANVLQHVPIPGMSPLQLACLQLATVSGAILGPKIFALYVRKSSGPKRTEKAGPSPLSTVPNFRG